MHFHAPDKKRLWALSVQELCWLCYSVFSSGWFHEHPLTTRICPNKMWYSSSYVILKTALKGGCSCHSLLFRWSYRDSKLSVLLMSTLMTQMVKNPPAMQEPLVWSLGQEDSLEKQMASHSIILAWRIPWPEEPGGLYSPWGCKE